MIAQIIIATIVFLMIYKIGMSFVSADKIKKRRIAELADTDESFAEIQEEIEGEKSSLARLMEVLVGGVKDTGNEMSVLRTQLMQAGWTSPNAPAYYMFFSTFGWLLAIVLGGLFYLIAKKYDGAMFYAVMMVGIFNCSMLAFGANLWLKNSIARRQAVLKRSFPDALDLLLICVESGLALDAALVRVCKELKYPHPEITKEFNRTRYELTVLNDREKALNNLALRTDLFAFKSLVTALLQAEKFGTSLVETLRVLSDEYRHERMMVAEEKAAKLPTKITVASIPFMLLALILLIASPAVLSISGSVE